MKIPSLPLQGWPGFAVGWAAGLGALLLAGAPPALDRRARALEAVDADAPNYLECYWAARAIRDELSRRAGPATIPR